MKTLFKTLCIVVLCFAFVGCGKDGNDGKKYKYNYFTEPYVGFGSDQATVKQNESRELFLGFNSGDFGLPVEEDFGLLIYKGENDFVDAVIYILEEDELEGSCVLIPMSDGNLTKVNNFLGERYKLIDSGSYDEMPYFYYESEDGKIGVDVETIDFSDVIGDVSLPLPGLPVDLSKAYIGILYFDNTEMGDEDDLSRVDIGHVRVEGSKFSRILGILKAME